MTHLVRLLLKRPPVLGAKAGCAVFALLAVVVLALGAWTLPAQAHGFGGTTTPGTEPQQNAVECADGECSPSKRDSKCDGSVADPVWTYNGSLHLRYTDLSVGRNHPIHVTRMYDSRSVCCPLSAKPLPRLAAGNFSEVSTPGRR